MSSACIYSNPTLGETSKQGQCKRLHSSEAYFRFSQAPRNFADRIIISRYLILNFHALRFLSQKRDISTIQS